MGPGVRRDDELRQPVSAPRHRTFRIAGHAGPAHFWPHRVNPARCRYPYPPRQGRAALAVAAHSGELLIDELLWDPLERGIVLGGEARPIPRIGAAGAARLARAAAEKIASFHGDPLARSALARYRCF